MSELTVSGENIPFFNFRGLGTGANAAKLRLYLSQSFITGGATGSGKVLNAGQPGSDGFYIELPITITLMTWNGQSNVRVAQLPSFVIDSTTDGQTSKAARYSAFFYSPTGKLLGPFIPFASFAVPPATDTGSLATWTQLAIYNTGIAPIPPAIDTYSREIVDAKLAAINAVTVPSGLAPGDLVTGSPSSMFARFPAHGGGSNKYLKQTGSTLSWGDIDPADITTGLGYTPVNKAGDSMSGNLTFTGSARPILAVQPTDGSADLDVASVLYVKNKTAAIGTGNVESINADETADQTLTVDNSTFPNLTITDNAAGDHKFGWTGQLSAPRGGTGFGSYAVGDLLYADTTTSFAKRSVGTAGQALVVSGGLPTWGQVSLTAGVTGTLPSANGGTGSAFFGISGPTALRTYAFPDANATIFTNQSIIPGANGGTGTGTYAIGDILAADTTTTLQRVAGNTTTTRKFLRGQGDGSVAGNPIWDVVRAVDIDVSIGGVLSLAQGGTGAATLAAGYIKSNGANLLSQAVPIPLADGGTNASSFANVNALVVYDGTSLVTSPTGAAGTVLAGGASPNYTATPTVDTILLNALTATGIVFLNGSKVSSVDATNFFWDNSAKQLNLRQGGIKIANTAGDNAFSIQANGSAGTTRSYIWPASYPSLANQVLASDTSGNLSWITASGGGGGSITIEGENGPAFLLAEGTSGSDFNITASNDGAGTSTLIFNIPSAASGVRGLVSTATQSFSGVKTFLDEVNFTNAKTVTFGQGSTAAPSLLIPTGSLLTSAQAGAIENDGTRLYYTNATVTRKSIAHLDDNITGNAAGFTGSLSGDITGTQGATAYNSIVPLTKGGTGSNIAALGSAGQFLASDGTNVVFTNSGSAITNLNAGNLASGFVPNARLTGVITDAEVNPSAAIAWSKISKTGSSLADLSTRSAADLNSGTLDDARLSTNVILTSDVGAANGVASLDGGTKVPNAQISEVLSITDLTTYATESGTGTTALRTTITTPSSGQVLMFNGTNWVNQGLPAAGTHNILSSTHPDTNSGAASVAVGDLLFGSDLVTSVWDKLPIGTADRVLTSTAGTNGVVPQWGQVNLTSMVTGTLAVANGGLGLTSGTSGGVLYFNSPNTLASSGALSAFGVVYGQGAGMAPTVVAGNTTTTRKFLRQTGDGTNPAAPAWDTIVAGDISELLGVTDLTTYASESGTGTTAIRATFTSLTTGDVIQWNGTNWVNVAGSGGPTPHDLLSATHPDTAAGTVVRGDLITGQTATPVWTRLAIDGANSILTNDGTDVAWGKVSLSTASHITGTLAVGNGGTGLTSGTSGGIPYFSGGTTLASSAALTANGVVLGGGAGASPTTTSAGSANQVLRVPGAGGAPAFGAIDLSQSAAVTGVVDETNGGTGNSSYTLGDTLYASAANTLSKLAGNTTTTRRFLRQVGDGANSAAPAWDTIAAGDIAELISVTQLTTYSAVSGTGTTAIALTLSSLTTGDILQWNGTNWVNIAPGASMTHNLLSATHPDTTAATVVRGDLIVGKNASPKWERLAIDGSNRILINDGTDVAWGKVSLSTASHVTGTLGAGNGGTGNAFFAVTGPATATRTFTFPNADATVLTTNAAVTVAQGGTGLTSGTSGGIPYFSGGTTLASSAALTANGVVLGGGAGASPTTTSAGSANQVFRVPGAGGAPAFGAIDLAQSAAVTGVLDETNGGTGNSSYTKGDILGASAANTLGKLAVGTNGQVLTANSSATLGFEWDDAPGMSDLTDDFITLERDICPITGTASGTGTGTSNTVYVIRFTIARKITISTVHTYVATAAASSALSFGIYSNDGNTRHLTSGSIDSSSTGTKSVTLGAPVTLNPGVYLYAYAVSTGTTLRFNTMVLNSNAMDLCNGDVTVFATAANSASSGVIPSTLGALTPVNSGLTPMSCKFQA